MTKRMTISLAVAAAAVVTLALWFWREGSGNGEGAGASAPQVEKRRAQKDLWHKLATKAVDPATAAAVSVDYKNTPLPEVLNQLVKQAGLTVTADLEKTHEKKLVTLQAFLTPLEALKLISLEYGLELQEMKDGWWLRPVPPKVEVIYQPPLQATEEERMQRLLQSLREIVGAVDREGNDTSGPYGPAVSMGTDGVHVSASRELQAEVQLFLDDSFQQKIPFRSEEQELKGIPALPRR